MPTKLFLGFNAIAIGLIGFTYLIDPNILLARYDLQTGSAGMDNMLRAAYGGLFVGIASLVALETLRENRRKDALALLIIFMGSQAIGRAASLALAGPSPDTIMGLFYYECAAVLIGLILWRRSAA